MKKRIICCALIFLCLISLISCQKSPENIYMLLTKINESFEDEVATSLMYSDTGTDGFTLADGKTLGRLYDGRWEAPGCASRIRAYAIRLPVDDSGFEIHILKCVSLSDRDEVASLVQRRIDRLQNAEIREYAPESYEKYFVGAEIYIKGDTVFLLATPDNRSVKKLIRKMCN